MEGILLPACSIVFSLLLCVIYFIKKRINIIENRMYATMIVVVLLDSILVTVLHSLGIGGLTNEKLHIINIINKIDFVLLIIYMSCLFMYICIITIEKWNKNHRQLIKIVSIVDLFVTVFIFLGSVNVISRNNSYSVSGTSIIALVAVSSIYLLLCVLIVISNIHKADKRHIPLASMIFIIFLCIILFQFNPYIIIISIAATFINYVMYFTIENPDIKIMEQLNILKDQADKANNAKTEFLSSMSHEIRTPLNAIDGFAQLILEEDNIDTIKEEARDIRAASENLIEIVNGILDISKIEANKLEIVNVEYEPKKVMEELVKLTRARIGEKPIDFRVNIAPDLPDFLNGDYVRLKQIILNLLTNSAKYTKKGFIEFEVRCVRINDICRLFIAVRDSGVGIKKENINKLFTRFERFDKEKNSTIEGTGLGLAITKKLVDLMGGRIAVNSIYGIGSAFAVAIDQKIVNKVKVVERVNNTPSHKLNYSNKKVLIVDDNQINLKVAGRLLATYEIDADEVDNGFDCIKLIDEGNKYDLILMDDMMPKMSGVETFKKLCEDDSFSTPVVALTANAIAGMKENYLKEGFSDYISKPIDKKELERVLNQFLD